MAEIYAIVKKNSTVHQAALASHLVKNSDIIEVAGTHVLVPSSRPVDFGHNVSHAKNRTQRLRRANMHVMRVEHAGETRVMRLTSRDLRTYKKLTTKA